MCLASTRLVIAAVVFVATDLAGLLAFMSANSHKCDGRWEKIQTIVLLCMTGNERWWPEKSSFYPAMISVISFFFLLWFSVGRNVESDSLTFEAIVHGLGDWQDWWNLREIELFFTASTVPLAEQTELINFQRFLHISDLVPVAWQTESTIRFRNSSPTDRRGRTEDFHLDCLLPDKFGWNPKLLLHRIPPSENLFVSDTNDLFHKKTFPNWT